MRYFVLLFSLLTAKANLAQLPKQYAFAHYSTTTGLGSNAVNSVVQDSTGFIWLGTSNGLQRYDGVKYLTFKHEHNNPRSIPENAVEQVLIDKTNRIWLLFASGRLGIFHSGNFTFSEITLNINEAILQGNRDKKLLATSNGTVLYIIQSLDVLAFQEKSQSFSSAAAYFHLPAGWRIADVYEEATNKKYWLGGNFGIAVFNSRTGLLSYAGHNTEREPVLELWGKLANATRFFVDSKARLWFQHWPANSSEGFVYAYDLKRKSPLLNQYSFVKDLNTYNEPRGFLEQQDGTIWIRGRNIFARYLEREGRFQSVYKGLINEQSIDYETVNDLMEDREQNIWIATSNYGLYRFDPLKQSFTNIRPWDRRLNKAGDRAVMSFIQTNRKTILAGTWGNGLYEYDSNFNNIPLHVQQVNNDHPIWDMCHAKDGHTIWMGAQPGLYAYDQHSGVARYYNPFGQVYQTVRAVQEDQLGNLWLGTNNKGIYKWGHGDKEKNRIDRIVHFAGTPEKLSISDLLTDSRGYLWAASSGNGVYVIDPRIDTILLHFTVQGPPDRRLLNDYASSLLQYDDSTIIILSGGLNIYNTKKRTISNIVLPEALVPEYAAIEKDGAGQLWISATNGIGKFDLGKKTLLLFGRADGITNDQFEEGVSLALPDGRLLFGNTDQFVLFDPAAMRPRVVAPNITITDFKVMNRSLRLDSITQLDGIDLPADQNFITIELAALSYSNRFQILQMLEGIDQDWKAVAGNQVVFSYLSPGTYTLLLKSRDTEGREGKNITRLTIRVHPHFWRTWWFNTLLILGIGALIYRWHKQKVNRLVEIEQVRSRVARDLHDDMGSSLSTINILSKVAANKMDADRQAAKEYMQRIADNSGRLMESMDDIIWAINPINDTMGKVLVRIKEFAADALEAREINVNFAVGENVRALRLDMESRRDFFLIFKEAINNIVKYSGASQVTIEINKINAALHISIADNGKGFEMPAIQPGSRRGHGLQNMQTRAQQLKGKLTIVSSTGKGTRIELIIPIA